MTAQDPAGWRTDPTDNAQWRFWDGADWTEHRRAKVRRGVTVGPPPPVPPVATTVAVAETTPAQSTGVARLLGVKTDAEKSAAAQYQELLDALVAGTADLQQLPAQLQGLANAAGFKTRKTSKLHDQAFRAFSQRLLEDDLLSAAEEDEMLAVAGALGIPVGEIERRFPDELLHMRIGKVNDGRLRVLDRHLLMTKPGEVVHMETPASVLKEVIHREYRGGGSGISVPIGGGVRFRTGGFRGKSVVVGSSFEPADSGTLSVTNRRVVFQGPKKTVECVYDKMVGVEVFTDALRIGVSNRQTASLFRVNQGQLVAATMNAAMQVPAD